MFLYKNTTDEYKWEDLHFYNEDLTFSDREYDKWDVIKVATIKKGSSSDMTYETVWERLEKTPQQIESEEIAQEMSELKAKLESLTERQKELSKNV